MPRHNTDTTTLTRGTRSFAWQASGRTIDVGYDVAGDGPVVLLLPAMGTASARAEMWPLARQLQGRFQTVAVDWPGFGAAPHPPVRWRPQLYREFLGDFCAHLFTGPVAVVAAGHASGYVLQQARNRPASWSRIALLAPTWRGPLPTPVSDLRRLCSVLRWLLQLPLLGNGFYRLGVTSPLLARMLRARVFANPAAVTTQLVAEKGRVARQRNARYACAAFVTGALDPVRSREAFLELVDQLLVPLLAVCGIDTPPPSWREMATLFQRPGVRVSRVPGALAPHEENPAPVSRAVQDFLLAADTKQTGSQP